MTKRKQESVRIVRSDDLNYVETKINELISMGYELEKTTKFNKKFVAVMIEYKEVNEDE